MSRHLISRGSNSTSAIFIAPEPPHDTAADTRLVQLLLQILLLPLHASNSMIQTAISAHGLSSPVYAGVHHCLCLLSRVHGRAWLQTRASSFLSHHKQCAPTISSWRGFAAALLVQGSLLSTISEPAPFPSPTSASPTRARSPWQPSPTAAASNIASNFQSTHSVSLNGAAATALSLLKDSAEFRAIAIGLRHSSPMVRSSIRSRACHVTICIAGCWAL